MASWFSRGGSEIGRVGILVLALGATTPMRSASADDVRVIVDQAKLVKLPEKVATIVLGNPLIADVSLQPGGVMVITGKSYGTTNLIVLDVNGGQIDNELLTVVPGEDQVVTVYRRSDRQTLSCTPACAPSITLGDNKDVFDSTKGQISGRGELAGAGN